MSPLTFRFSLINSFIEENNGISNVDIDPLFQPQCDLFENINNIEVGK